MPNSWGFSISESAGPTRRMSAARDIVFDAAGAAAGTSGDASWTSAASCRGRGAAERGVDLNTTNRTKRTKVGNMACAAGGSNGGPRAAGKFFSGHATLT